MADSKKVIELRDALRVEALKNDEDIEIFTTHDYYEAMLEISGQKPVSQYNKYNKVKPILERAKSIQSGGFYTFSYDPLYKKTLSEYDIFPLVFILGYSEDVGSDGLPLLIGINLHFLLPRYKVLFLDYIFGQNIEPTPLQRFPKKKYKGVVKLLGKKHAPRASKHYLQTHVVGQDYRRITNENIKFLCHLNYARYFGTKKGAAKRFYLK